MPLRSNLVREPGRVASHDGPADPGREVVGVVAAAAVIVGAIWIAHRHGASLERDGFVIQLRMAPFYGRPWEPIDGGWWAALGFGAVLVAGIVRAARSCSVRLLAGVTGGVHALWALGLAWLHDPTEIGRPMAHRHGYLPMVDRIDGVGEYWRSFLDAAPTYPIHVRGHPPLFPLWLVGLDRVGLGGETAAGVMVVLVGASGAAAVVLTTRLLVGEQWARRAAPFIGVAAFAPMVASTADAAFSGVAAWSIWSIVAATTSRGRHPIWFGGLAGTLIGIGLLLSYGSGIVAVVCGAIALIRRKVVVAAIATATSVAVLTLAWLLGFSYLDGLRYVRDEYEAGVASQRPFWSFALFNVVAFSAIVGPAAAAALVYAVRRRSPILAVAGIGVTMATIALISGMSKGEVERIWLSFAIWTVAVGAIYLRRSHIVIGLGTQVVSAVVLQFAVKSW